MKTTKAVVVSNLISNQCFYIKKNTNKQNILEILKSFIGSKGVETMDAIY